MAEPESLVREHIRDTVVRYNIAGDQRNLAGFLSVFTDDAFYASGLFHCEGKAAIEAHLRTTWSAIPVGPVARFRRHHLTTMQIDIIGPRTASGRIYFTVFTDLGPDHCGSYVDKYREEAGRWLICERKVYMDWSHPASLCVPEAVKRALLERKSRN